MLSLKQTLTSLAVAATLGAAAPAFAATDAYLTNSTTVSAANPEGVVKNSIGECWQTSSWTKDKAVKGCPGYVEPVAAAAPAPAPAAPAPAPAPTVSTKKFTLQAEVLFDFNKSVLKPSGKDALDQLYNEVANLDPKEGAAVVVGHTDRIGSDKYNEELGYRRAKAVQDYLISKGAPADRISAETRGKREPVTGDTCDKVKPRAKLIECLAPDRRVEIEVRGTREVTETK